jgi:diguanylate cyclase (GGDEF)-like protein
MRFGESAIGMALMCDLQGTIVNVLQNDFPIESNRLIGNRLPAIFSTPSLPKALRFVFELRKQGRFFDCELYLEIDSRSTLLHCAGLAFKNGLLVVAAQTRYAIQELFEGMIRINRDQARLTQQRSNKVIEPDQNFERGEVDVFSQLTAMNNELVTLDRELHKKNAELKRLNEEVLKLARVDQLTSLLNRRGFYEAGEREVLAANRFHKPLAAIMIDVDHFKNFNDTHGHATGDDVLRWVAQRCTKCVREVDLVGRYGGEEFSILLPETDREGGETAAEWIRAVVADSPCESAGNMLSVTISLGVAALKHGEMSLDELLQTADRALYRAKLGGRNQVCAGVGG